MKVSNFYHLQCIDCGSIYDERETATRCLKCHESLDVIYDYEKISKRLHHYAIKNAPISALKYVDFYPINDLGKIVSLKEGNTPLYKADNLGKMFGLNRLYVKHEGMNPTGVFKDRGTLVEVTKALELNASAICLASSGNMAASCAAYAAKAKIPCYVLVPEGTPIGKLAQTISYGARVLQIRAPYSTCAKLAEETAKKHNFYLAGDYVFRGEGQKSQAFEIIEQLDWQVPDYVIVPVGCGTNMAAIWKGFWEFKKLGLVDKVPKMIGVQPSGCAPVYESFKKGHDRVGSWGKIETLCSAVAVSDALDGNKLLRGIRESNGDFVMVTDEETLKFEQILAKEESIFVEPSGALGVSALAKLAKENFFKEDDLIVISTTGNGLKDPVTALKYQPAPATLEPEMTEIDRYLEHKLYNLRATQVADREKTLWSDGIPSAEILGNFINDEFGIEVAEKYLQEIILEIENFDKKGKKITEQDLQHIIENTLQEFSTKESVLHLKDFKLSVYKEKRAEAEVTVVFKGVTINEKSEGVGPVDALIDAIRKAIKSDDSLDCKLTDYQVTIHSGGTDAAVEVRIKLKDNRGNEIMGSATSPDIIQASVKAFLRGYNGLYRKP